jgi:hypothetical protein
MTKARHIAVMNYLIAEAGLPYARPVGRDVFGQPEGTALALPPPFESAVVRASVHGSSILTGSVDAC